MTVAIPRNLSVDVRRRPGKAFLDGALDGAPGAIQASSYPMMRRARFSGIEA